MHSLRALITRLLTFQQMGLRENPSMTHRILKPNIPIFSFWSTTKNTHLWRLVMYLKVRGGELAAMWPRSQKSVSS